MQKLHYKIFLSLPLLILFFLVNPQLASAQTFTFGALGDFGNGSGFNGNVQKIKSDNPAFVVGLGDFAYSPVEQTWCNVWRSNYSNLVLVSGNHDDGGGDGSINNYVTHCPTLNVSKTGTYGKQYYFDYPQTSPIARFILISPGVSGPAFTGLETTYRTGSQSYNFVSSAIDGARSAGIKWVIVGMHKNYISAMVKRNELGPDLMNLLLTKKVDLILQGHEHGYERSKQLTCARIDSYDASCVVDSDNSLVKGAGSVIHVIGTGGAGTRGVNTSDSEYPYFAATDASTYGYGKFVVSPGSIVFNFIPSSRGTYTDSFTITAGGGGSTSTPVPTATGGSNLQAVDINGDRTVNIIDIGIVVDNYGRNPIPNIKADINRDGTVNIIDIGLIIDRYGQSY